ncbi:MAG: hypothetical protein FRX48_06223 [Lasallia pustulata]|uniref:Uncharacterized protein n=1 Tax=Lasallia pustulata TaxID=136370 RepID=A0A1W5D3G6_9LECA|nr:MAG: hypothetical protein FRX48_06223 [Lasallia pustulata]SLM37674.1 hypothetical protein LPUS_07597 [Lasallia pustulata]
MALQIPDLETLGQAFNTIQVEVGKVANHSAWNNGAMINNQLNQVLAQLNDVNTLTARFNAFETCFNAFETRFNSSDHNAMARIANSGLSLLDDELTPLVARTTNQLIPNFPNTPADVEQMTHIHIDPVIAALGGTVQGNINQKRLRLRRLLGLTPRLI